MIQDSLYRPVKYKSNQAGHDWEDGARDNGHCTLSIKVQNQGNAGFCKDKAQK
jgi:hypothetical protein